MGFWTTIFLSACVSSIAATGLFLQIRGGQMNVGMAVFVGIGAYTSGALGTLSGWQPVASIPVAVAVGFLVGMGFSALTLRLHHWFFAVTTLSLSLAAVAAAGQIGFLGGNLGLTNIPFMTDPTVIIACAVAAVAVAWRIDHSAAGLAIRAMGNDQVLAEVFGVRTRLLRIVTFGVGSALAALSGALHAHRFGTYQPNDLGFHNSLLLFVYVIVGGKNRVWGPVLGALFLFMMPEVIHIDPRAELIVFGALMLLVAVLLPDGLAGALVAAVRPLRRAVR
ncbi:MAG: branched-chain amino acid ABC transporter permease [Acetobacteraceae bacterium]|nr:branched-chain amino acid ABC transporter permease [Pseudomonadota bacterium]